MSVTNQNLFNRADINGYVTFEVTYELINKYLNTYENYIFFDN